MTGTDERLPEGLLENLDGFLLPDELLLYARKLRDHECETAACERVRFLLIDYAECKAAAMECRLKGLTTAALRNEDRCEIYYQRLPEWARW